MSDGNNTGKTDAQNVEQLKALQDEVAKFKKQWEDSQQMIQKQSNEVGEVRKKIEQTEKEAAELKAKLAEAEKKTATPPKEETANDIAMKLAEDQRKIAEQMFAGLTDEEKVKYRDDENFRKDFLLQVSEHKPVPQSPWLETQKKVEKETPSAHKKRIRELFEQTMKQSKSVPPGSSGGELAGKSVKTVPAQSERQVQRLAGIMGRNYRPQEQATA